LSIKPDLAEAWFGRGDVFLSLKRFTAAAKRRQMNPPALALALITGILHRGSIDVAVHGRSKVIDVNAHEEGESLQV
jgi:hypothetical protein